MLFSRPLESTLNYRIPALLYADNPNWDLLANITPPRRSSWMAWVTVLGGLAASLAVIASTFPLLDRITGPDVARNE
jgi:hypothetical protein